MDQTFNADVVSLVLNGRVEQALAMLAEHYGVSTPRITVGLPKGRKRGALGCYNAKDKMIMVVNSDTFKDPFVILHEFYHHLRTRANGKHRGTEKHANDFAREFIEACKSTASRDGAK